MIIVDTILYLIVDVIANDFGALLRFTYHKYIKREKVVYSNFQAGNTRKTRRGKNCMMIIMTRIIDGAPVFS